MVNFNRRTKCLWYDVASVAVMESVLVYGCLWYDVASVAVMESVLVYGCTLYR